MMRVTELAHLLVRPALIDGAWAVDATVGNGHDTLWLAERTGPTGRVYAFDVQLAALTSAAKAVQGMAQVSLIHAGHENMAALLPVDAKGRISVVMFNLGYLPGADRAVITHTLTTLEALGHALGLLRVGGVISVIVYPGHTGGMEEAAAVRAWAGILPGAFAASVHARVNARTAAPELIVVERMR